MQYLYPIQNHKVDVHNTKQINTYNGDLFNVYIPGDVLYLYIKHNIITLLKNYNGILIVELELPIIVDLLYHIKAILMPDLITACFLDKNKINLRLIGISGDADLFLYYNINNIIYNAFLNLIGYVDLKLGIIIFYGSKNINSVTVTTQKILVHQIIDIHINKDTLNWTNNVTAVDITDEDFRPYFDSICLYNLYNLLLAISKLKQPIKKLDTLDFIAQIIFKS